MAKQLLHGQTFQQGERLIPTCASRIKSCVRQSASLPERQVKPTREFNYWQADCLTCQLPLPIGLDDFYVGL